VKKYLIHGGKPLSGSVRAEGAKNAALPLMAACLLVPGPVVLERVPDVQDIRTMAELLRLLGVKVKQRPGGEVLIDATEITSFHAPYELVSRMRASIYIMGPLLAREGRATVALPGGCAFGPRPVNFHVDGLRMMGVSMKTRRGEIDARCKGLRGMEMEMPSRSVGATAHLMMAAALATGETTLRNAAMEPDVVAVAEFLNLCGARVEGVETGVVRITGVEKLSSPPGRFSNIPDRIETGTMAVAAMVTRGDVRVEGANPSHAAPTLEKIAQMGGLVETGEDWIRVLCPERPKACDIVTSPHPGFPTDMQPAMLTALALARGVSTVTETIYPDRFKHAWELNRLGADISVEGSGRAVVRGVESLSGAPVTGSDLRASAALALAGMAACDETTLYGIEHLERGYEDFPQKMRSLGASLEVVEDEARD